MVDLLTRGASLAPTTADSASRTVRATISTGAAVAGKDAAGPFRELLDLDGVNPSDLVGVPVLDRHRQDSVDRVLGVVTAAGRDVAGLWADLQISARAEGVWSDIRAGILRGVSVGYDVARWQEGHAADGARTKTATSWKVREVSFVPLPADAGANIRSQGGNMDETNGTAAPGQSADAFKPCPDCKNPGHCTKAGGCFNAGANGSGGTGDAPPKTDAAPAPGNGSRAAAIRTYCRAVGMDTATADGLIDRGASVEEARAAAFDTILTRSAGRPLGAVQMLQDHDDPSTVIDRMATAFAHRATANLPQAHRVALPDAARSYAGRSLLSLAAELADRRGAPISRYADPAELYTRAMTTSDFPNLLANVSNKVLLPAYENATPSYRRFFQRRDLRDYRPTNLVRVGDFPVPLAVGESGEYKTGAISDSGQTAQLAHYGRIITLSRQALVNDDLNGFADLPGKAALRVADWENSVAWAHVVSNPTLGDGLALFHATHGNLATSGAAISVAAVGVGESAMMKQTSLDGLKLNLRPAVLAVSPDQLTLARQFTTTITPFQVENVNPFASQIDPLGDANLSGTGWYLFAEPTALESFNFGYLQGAAGPQITPEPGFDVAGMRLRLSIDFYVQAVDYRGAYFNLGA